MKHVLLTFLLALVGLQAFAQDERPMVIYGKITVTDEVTRKLLRGADISLLDTLGRQLEPIQISENTGTVNDKETFNGYHIVTYELVDTLVIRANKEGHEPMELFCPHPSINSRPQSATAIFGGTR